MCIRDRHQGGHRRRDRSLQLGRAEPRGRRQQRRRDWGGRARANDGPARSQTHTPAHVFSAHPTTDARTAVHRPCPTLTLAPTRPRSCLWRMRSCREATRYCSSQRSTSSPLWSARSLGTACARTRPPSSMCGASARRSAGPTSLNRGLEHRRSSTRQPQPQASACERHQYVVS